MKYRSTVSRLRHASGLASPAAPLAAAAPRGLSHNTIDRKAMRVLHRTVLAYWKAYGRHDLPWRQTTDPYAILVSEMMLQQTQVHRVVPYFERWMKKYPTPHTLATAPLSEALRMWSGLGYNRRAKYLHESAKTLSRLSYRPSKKIAYEDLRKLPGVGEYTAKAVRVFAWDEPEVLIETNVRTVFIHHFFPRGKRVSDARLMPLIAEAVCNLPKGVSPRTWYAALMDYGSHLKSAHPNPSRKSKHHSTQSTFKGSLREVRGAVLRSLAKNEKISTLYREFGITRVEESLKGLERDGLITKERLSWKLAR